MSLQQECVILILDPTGDSHLRCAGALRDAVRDSMTLSISASYEGLRRDLAAALQRKAHLPLIMCHAEDDYQDALALFKEIRAEFPFLNSSFLLVLPEEQPSVFAAIQEQHLVSHILVETLSQEEMYRVFKDVLSHYLLQYAYDQLSYYEDIVSHHHYRRALEQSIQHRVELSAELAQFASNLLDIKAERAAALLDRFAAELHQIVAAGTSTEVFSRYQKGDFLLQRGVINQRLHIILRGEVEHQVSSESEAEIKVFREGAGAIIGSLSFFSSRPTVTTVRALTELEVVSLDLAGLERLMSESPRFLLLFNQLLLRQFLSRSRLHLEANLELHSTLDELRRTQLHLIESEKLATLGQLVAGVAHELNNPVAAIIRSSDHLAQFLTEVIASPVPQGGSLHHLAEDCFARGRTLIPMSTRDLRRMAQELEPVLPQATLARQAVEIGFEKPEDLRALQQTSGQKLEDAISVLNRYFRIGQGLRNIEATGSRIEALVKSLRSYAKQDMGVFEAVDVHQGIEESLMILQHRLQGFELIKTYGSLPMIQALPASLKQVWTNLIANALEAMGSSGLLQIKTELLPSGTTICVKIRDNGPGIPPEIRERIFDLNFTTKRGTGFGLGLGLTICKSIVEKHRGKIEVSSEPGVFTEFAVFLPLDSCTKGDL